MAEYRDLDSGSIRASSAGRGPGRTPRALVAALVLLLVAVLAADPVVGQQIYPLAEVETGQRGHGFTVFSGARPERFELEVLGVWRNVQPGLSYVLARLEGRGLKETGVIAGMSGSPVYIDDRLAGAVAFAWPFAREPIAGITPIEQMRELARPGRSATATGRAAWPHRLEDLVEGAVGREDLVRELSLLAPEPAPGARGGLQWVAAGLGGAGHDLLTEAVGPVAPAGAAESRADADLLPGSAVAAVLVDGDLRLAATGTVTDRIGDRVLAFGHSFLGLGPVSIPMASAEVVTVVSSRASSFKVANVGGVVGALDFDQMAGVSGVMGAEAPMLPMAVRIRGEQERDLHMRVAAIPLVSPSLVAISVIGALEANADSAGSRGIDLEARFDLGERGELELRQSFDGTLASVQAAIHLFAVTGYLLQNPLAEVKIESIEIEARSHVEPRTARLVGAHATRTLVRPGERVGVNLDLAPYRGQPFRRSLELELPTDLPEGRYSLLVGDGMSIDAARLAVERAEPVSFRQALGLLRSLHSRREVVVLGVFAGAGLAVAGEVMPQLPGSVASLWGAAASGSAVPLKLALAQQESLELDVPVEGILRIDLEVKRREPLTAGRGEPSEPEKADSAPPRPPAGGGRTLQDEEDPMP